MKKHPFIPKLFSASLTFILAQGVSHAMPGMHGSGSGAATEHPRVSNSLGGKINSSGSEKEITYSADGKTAIFVSSREGSIQSIWGRALIPRWGQTSIPRPGSWSRAFPTTAM